MTRDPKIIIPARQYNALTNFIKFEKNNSFVKIGPINIAISIFKIAWFNFNNFKETAYSN